MKQKRRHKKIQQLLLQMRKTNFVNKSLLSLQMYYKPDLQIYILESGSDLFVLNLTICFSLSNLTKWLVSVTISF